MKKGLWVLLCVVSLVFAGAAHSPSEEVYRLRHSRAIPKESTTEQITVNYLG